MIVFSKQASIRRKHCIKKTKNDKLFIHIYIYKYMLHKQNSNLYINCKTIVKYAYINSAQRMPLTTQM